MAYKLSSNWSWNCPSPLAQIDGEKEIRNLNKVVFYESVNLIGYITAVYLLIDNSFTRDCTRDPLSTWRATFEPNVTQ